MKKNVIKHWESISTQLDARQLERALQTHPLYPLDSQYSGLDAEQWAQTVVRLYKKGFDSFVQEPEKSRQWLRVLFEQVGMPLRVSAHWVKEQRSKVEQTQMPHVIYDSIGDPLEVFETVSKELLKTKNVELIRWCGSVKPELLEQACAIMDVPDNLDIKPWMQWFDKVERSGSIPLKQTGEGLLWVGISEKVEKSILQAVRRPQEKEGYWSDLLYLSIEIDHVEGFAFLLNNTPYAVRKCLQKKTVDKVKHLSLAQKSMIYGSPKVFEFIQEYVQSNGTELDKKRLARQTILDPQMYKFMWREMSTQPSALTLRYDEVSAQALRRTKGELLGSVWSVDNAKQLLCEIILSHREGYKTLHTALSEYPNLLNAPSALEGLGWALCTESMRQIGVAEVLISKAHEGQLKQWIEYFEKNPDCIGVQKGWSLADAKGVRKLVDQRLTQIKELMVLECKLPNPKGQGQRKSLRI